MSNKRGHKRRRVGIVRLVQCTTRSYDWAMQYARVIPRVCIRIFSYRCRSLCVRQVSSYVSRNLFTTPSFAAEGTNEQHAETVGACLHQIRSMSGREACSTKWTRNPSPWCSDLLEECPTSKIIKATSQSSTVSAATTSIATPSPLNRKHSRSWTEVSPDISN